ncbi:UTP--glucose-1-phosphate uridylyltransferase [Phocoenobacter uteri]|uniref:UTP--glucose-1-phosphate uridylyltransferase n=1 Tax=Phocoenobacter uteri TaxID=146806 RepID=A0A379CAK7_9PAST|nr:UTP--glucose-1-phosphate uridylyltransferase GalU [Phocoenobacter uteri]MDG6881299.1 UTP--glucose-1-phosphate uridylyltransferase [Phocoenobacter uteri]SUB59323.1 UTP--glucose-1-phosphate uridylyltransferase [Phocoenobacter uteri]
MKVIIPVAGLGTRMLPATKAIPKEMLTIADKPLIHYIVKECVDAGFKEIVLVTHSSKNSIENYFDTTFELETMLERRQKKVLLEEVRNIIPEDVRLIHIRQGQAKGLGHAVLCARSIIGDDDFAVVLPDVLLPDFSSNHKTENLSAMVQRFNKTGYSQIMVSPVPREKVKDYGIADCLGVDIQEGESTKIVKMVEKPEIEDAPSNLAVVGRYVFSKNLWPLLEQTKEGTGGEIQLTDAIDSLIANREQNIEAFRIKGDTFDCGDKIGYAQAFIKYSLHNPKMKDSLKQYLKEIVKELN